MPVWLSWFLVFIGLCTPLAYMWFIPKKLLLILGTFPLVFFSIQLVIKGIGNNQWLVSHTKFSMNIFFISFIEITFSLGFILYHAIKNGIIFVLSDNPWDKLGFQASIFIRLFCIVLFMFSTSIMFAPLYGFWKIYSKGYMDLGGYDTIYYSLTIGYGIPQTGVFEQFQHGVNSNGVLRFVQLTHIVCIKIIEFIAIGVIISHLEQLIRNKLTVEEKPNFRTVHLNQIRRKRQKKIL